MMLRKTRLSSRELWTLGQIRCPLSSLLLTHRCVQGKKDPEDGSYVFLAADGDGSEMFIYYSL
jgi:hypothetical protein